MATVLPSLQELRSINFGDCLLRSGGARAIAAAIHDGHRQLEVLSVQRNFSLSGQPWGRSVLISEVS